MRPIHTVKPLPLQVSARGGRGFNVEGDDLKSEFFSPPSLTIARQDEIPARWSVGNGCALRTAAMKEPSDPLEDNAPVGRVWTFAKGGDELSVEHSVEGGLVVMTLVRSRETGDETIRVYEFPTEAAAAEFNANLDASLLQFGWMFVGYLPNRRIHHERRHGVRRSDRRRWWTDGGTFLE